MSKRFRTLSSESTIRSLPHLSDRSARGCCIRILVAALTLMACQVGLIGQATAQDTDGDGLTDFEEVSRVRTVPFGPQQVITTAATLAKSVFAADLDGDGDPDVLSGSHEIAWYENRLNEASADFGAKQVIPAWNVPNSVFAADLDGDGDPDVLSAGDWGDEITWNRNRLDEPSADFGPPILITSLVKNVRSVFAADLDGDGDPDVLSASYPNGEIAWYENRLNEASADFGA